MQNRILKTFSAFLALLIAATVAGCGSQKTSSENTVTSKPSQTTGSTTAAKLTILNDNAVEENFIGFGGIYMCYNYIADNAEKYTDEMMQIEMDRLADMKVSVIRTQYRFDYAFDFDKKQWNWESENMKGFYTFMDEMQKRGISVAIQIGYFDNDVLKEGNPFDVLSGGNTEKKYSLYGEWVAESVKQIRAHGAKNLDYLVAFTEPCQPWTEKEKTVEKAAEKMAVWKKSLLAADSALKKSGIRDTVKIIGPNAANNQFLLDYAVQDKEVSAALDIFSLHTYVTGATMYDDTYYQWYEDFMQPMKEAVKETGKEIWMDEWNFKLSNDPEETRLDNTWLGTQNAIGMIAGMNAGLQTMLRWTLADQKWPYENQTAGDGWQDGVQRCGITPNLLTSSIPRPAYYAYSLISKYTNGKNVKVYKGNGREQVYLTACQLDDGNWTVIVANSSIVEKEFNISFKKELGVSLYRHTYNPQTVKPTPTAHIADPDKGFSNVKSSLSDKIPAGGVYVYTSVKD